MIKITNSVFISDDELEFRFSRSAGPGGQNVNKVNTRVTVRLDIPGCGSFSEEQKKRILTKLATRANKEGVIRAVSQKYRTQNANRQAATEKLVELLSRALETRPVRKKTKVPYKAKQRRLEDKKRRSMLKQQRMKKGLGFE